MQIDKIEQTRKVETFYVNILWVNLTHSFGVTVSSSSIHPSFNSIEVYKIKDLNYSVYKTLDKSIRKEMKRLVKNQFN